MGCRDEPSRVSLLYKCVEIPSLRQARHDKSTLIVRDGGEGCTCLKHAHSGRHGAAIVDAIGIDVNVGEWPVLLIRDHARCDGAAMKYEVHA